MLSLKKNQASKTITNIKIRLEYYCISWLIICSDLSLALPRDSSPWLCAHMDLTLACPPSAEAGSLCLWQCVHYQFPFPPLPPSIWHLELAGGGADRSLSVFDMEILWYKENGSCIHKRQGSHKLFNTCLWICSIFILQYNFSLMLSKKYYLESSFVHDEIHSAITDIKKLNILFLFAILWPAVHFNICFHWKWSLNPQQSWAYTMANGYSGPV